MKNLKDKEETPEEVTEVKLSDVKGHVIMDDTALANAYTVAVELAELPENMRDSSKLVLVVKGQEVKVDTERRGKVSFIVSTDNGIVKTDVEAGVIKTK